MQTITPERSIEQRMTALEKANDHRIKRADWKKAVKRGEANPLDVLAGPPAELASMKVYDWLRCQRGVGKVKASKLLRLCRISAGKTLGGLSERQRNEIAMFLSWRR